MRHQVLILNRGRKRAPNLRSSDRIIAGLCTLLMRPARVLRSAIVLKTSTLLHFHKMLVQQKYRLLFSPKRVRPPGPKGPTKQSVSPNPFLCFNACFNAQANLSSSAGVFEDIVRRVIHDARAAGIRSEIRSCFRAEYMDRSPVKTLLTCPHAAYADVTSQLWVGSRWSV